MPTAAVVEEYFGCSNLESSKAFPKSANAAQKCRQELRRIRWALHKHAEFQKEIGRARVGLLACLNG